MLQRYVYSHSRLRRLLTVLCYSCAMTASAAFPAGAGTTTYTYDSFGRVTKVLHPDASLSCYSYDDAGNRSLVTTTAQATACATVGNISTGLHQGEYISSSDARFKLILQTDSNFVLYYGSTALWSTSTVGKSVTLATFQGDGNLVLYNSSYSAVWASNTFGNTGSKLVLQNDGNLVIYSSSGSAIWSTGTCCH